MKSVPYICETTLFVMQISEEQVVLVPIDEIKPYPNNSKTHSEHQIQEIIQSIKEFGWTVPCLLDENKMLLAGHGRHLAGRKLGMTHIKCLFKYGLSEKQKRAYVIADNKLTENGGWDLKKLTEEVDFLIRNDFDATVTGFSMQEIDDLLKGLDTAILPAEQQGNQAAFANLARNNTTAADPKKNRKNVGSLADKFMAPPFSVLDARTGKWQERKRAWLGLGIKGEIGRAEELTIAGDKATKDGLHGYRKDKGLVRADYENDKSNGTSVFDPVLCELIYKWFCPKGGSVNDFCTGGPVRGVVAAKLGLEFNGIDLRAEQIAANIENGRKIVPENMPNWITGDGVDALELFPAKKCDLSFTCPPYLGLEKYSDLPNDLSNMSHAEFMDAYGLMVRRNAELLKNDRFAVIVVGDVRDKGTGFYCNFVRDTIRVYEEAGLRFYNDAILLTAIGSASLRAGRQFSSTRKLCKVHQNILVFVKGEPKKATEACGDVDVSDALSDLEIKD